MSVSWNDLIKNSAGSFDPLPNGDYDTVVVDAAAAVTSTDKGMIKAKFKVTSGPHANRHVWNQFVISPENPNALSFFFQHMKVFGMDENFFTQLPTFDPSLGEDDPAMQRIASMMVNKPARLTLSQRTYQGTLRNEVKAVKPSLGGAVGPGAVPQAAAPGPGPVGATPSPSPTPAVPQAAPQAAPTPAPTPAPAPTSAPPAPPEPAQPANRPNPDAVSSFNPSGTAENPWKSDQGGQSGLAF